MIDKNYALDEWFGYGTPEEREYNDLVGKYYPNKITENVAKKMLVLEGKLGLPTLVPKKFQRPQKVKK